MKLKNLIWIIPAILVVILLFIFSMTKYESPICGDGICQAGEVEAGKSFCDIDCATECITTGVEDVDQCSVGWGVTYLKLVDEGLIKLSYLKETEEIDFLHPEIKKLAIQLKRDTIKETIEAIADWTYKNIRYDSAQSYADCTDTKASQVISRKKGVCSTMSKVNIALLRANGIPAYSITGCWKYKESCDLFQTFSIFYPELFKRFIDIEIDDTGYAATYGSLHNWVIVPLYRDGVIEDVLVESTSGRLHAHSCINYREYYTNPSDSLACGLYGFDPNVNDCKEW